MTFNYPDFDNAVPDAPCRSLMPDGYSEFQFLEAVRTIIRACGGNRSVAQGVAIELVLQETKNDKR